MAVRALVKARDDCGFESIRLNLVLWRGGQDLKNPCNLCYAIRHLLNDL